jgi:hypothetical protein
MVQGATDGSIHHGQERPMEKQEREGPHSKGMEWTEGELGWKKEGERRRHIGRTRPERRSHDGEVGEGGQEWRDHCKL